MEWEVLIEDRERKEERKREGQRGSGMRDG